MDPDIKYWDWKICSCEAVRITSEKKFPLDFITTNKATILGAPHNNFKSDKRDVDLSDLVKKSEKK